jgi:hypothetical protein
MKNNAKLFVLFFLCIVALAAQQTQSHRLANSMQAKLDHLEKNAAKPRPDPAPTVITEDEINDYLAAGRVKLPQGVKKVTFQGQSGIVTAFLTVDFDEIKAGRGGPSNPLLSIFNGTHNVRAEADAVGVGGTGKVHIRTVEIDGVIVPRMALQFFIDRYLRPKYPDIGMDSAFKLPERIDTATVGYHKLTVTQK